MGILEKVKNIGRGIMDAILPAVCTGCGKEGAYICERCSLFIGEAALICPVCDVSSFGGARHTQCENSRYGLNGLASIWEFEGVMKQLLVRIKYFGITHAIEELVGRAFFTMAKDRQRFASFLTFLLHKDTALTFVPIYRRKEKRRGFNQAHLVAREIGKVSGRQVFPLLRKIRDTESQTSLSKEERLQNMKDAFGILNANREMPQNVVLVDDIWTTGATMKECCKELKKNGAETVWGFTLARTV